MITFADAALLTFTAALLFAVHALGKSIRGAVATLLPFAAAVLAFMAVLAVLALFFGFGAASGGVGHTPTATSIVRVMLLVVAAGSGMIAGVLTARFADRWAPPEDDEESASPAWASRRHVRLGLAVLIGIGAFPASHEYRLWRAVEIAGRSSDQRAVSKALSQLERMKDPRALPVLKRLGALNAMGSMGEPGKKALFEYLRTSPDPDLRAGALGSLCRVDTARDPEVVAAFRQALGDPRVQVRVAGIRCSTLMLGPLEAVASLEPLLEDEVPEVREAASDELGRLGVPQGSVSR